MNLTKNARAGVCAGLLLAGLASCYSAQAQPGLAQADPLKESELGIVSNSPPQLVPSIYAAYYSQTDGLSLKDIVKRAFDANGEVKIAKLEVDKARARLDQARKLPNPSIEIEQTNASLVGGGSDRSFSVGVGMPIDVFGQRRSKVSLAEAEITLREAEVSARQREIVAQIFVSYTEALAALRELKVIEDLLELDTETTRFVQIRVNEGEVPPLELSLLQAEVERLRARRSLVEGKLQSAYSRLRFFAGIEPETQLRLSEEITTAQIPKLPPSIEVGLATALLSRPEIKVAQLEENLAAAGLRLARAQGKADLTGYTRYNQDRSTFEDPRGSYAQRDRSLTFGVSITVPIFNRNQGAKAEAEIAIRQAQERKVFYEQVIKSEVVAAFQRVEASRKAVSTLAGSVIPRSMQNVATVRRVYELGELKITDLIAEQRRLLDANRDLSDTLAERYRAQADLFIATGLKFED